MRERESTMGESESHLEQAEQHIQKLEAFIAQQEALIDDLERDGHAEAAERGREVLVTLRKTLEAAREHRRTVFELS
jgi:hypothetical protein